MSDCYRFFVEGNPIPKARARVVNGHAYTPQTTVEWEAQVRRNYIGPRFDGPVSIEMHFWRRNKRRADLDNLEKAVMDSLNGVAWRDDSQVIEKYSRKEVDPNRPGVTIVIAEAIEEEIS